jgi:hypothetical protein
MYTKNVGCFRIFREVNKNENSTNMVTLAGKQAAASPLCRLVRRSTIQHFFVISFQLKTFLQEEPRGRFCKILGRS